MLLDEENYLAHYGIIRRSGRYPWGSSGWGDGPKDEDKNPFVTQNNRGFIEWVRHLFNKGWTETQIAEGFGMSTTQLRAARTVAKSEQKAADIAQIEAFKAKGMSNVAIASRMDMPESTVRSYLKPSAKLRQDAIDTGMEILKDQLKNNPGTFIDVGAGAEQSLNLSKERLNVALEILKSEGYEVHTNIKERQLGTGHETIRKALAPPGTEWGDVAKNKDKILQIREELTDTGRSGLGLAPPIAVNPKRVEMIWGPDGGAQADGVVYLRPGVKDLDLGGANYAQVRIQVGPAHYIKGMALYKDDMPPGVDIQFNTPKDKTENKLDVLKPLNTRPDGSIDADNPFGAYIRKQITTENSKGETVATSAVNLVNEEGNWSDWSDSIASQVLSKQPLPLAREQLNMTFEARKNQFNEIKGLTNPTVKKKLLEDFADGADSAAVHLKAANLPRQAWHAILPLQTLSPTEIYAPNYNDGERVALIRYPHGGTFEIPELVVNNRNREANRLMKGAADAVGINPSVAERLSGADFDGDTVLVIPNNTGKIKSSPALEGLRNFNPREEYRGYEGMKVMKNTQTEMGMISNLITDMTIQGAPPSELARAVRHSMVVIDAEKHELNYKLSEQRNGIKKLKEKYQPQGGASTIISRAGSQTRVPKSRPRPMAKGGPVDKKTGELVFEPTGATNYRTGALLTDTKKKLEVTKDARDLSSGGRMENLYADHSNRLKDLANQARLEALNTPRASWSPSAKKAYSSEVTALDNKLALSKSNAPRERRAQSLGNAILKARKDDNPSMDPETEKKIKFQALEEARLRTGAKKHMIEITSKEWEAIQAGAISDSKLKEILRHADMDKVKELARPPKAKKLSTHQMSRAMSMLSQGFTQAEIARQLGVSVDTLKASTSGKD